MWQTEYLIELERKILLSGFAGIIDGLLVDTREHSAAKLLNQDAIDEILIDLYEEEHIEEVSIDEPIPSLFEFYKCM